MWITVAAPKYIKHLCLTEIQLFFKQQKHRKPGSETLWLRSVHDAVKTNLPKQMKQLIITQLSSCKNDFLAVFERGSVDSVTNPANELGNLTFGKQWGWMTPVVKWSLQRRRSAMTNWQQFCQTLFHFLSILQHKPSPDRQRSTLRRVLLEPNGGCTPHLSANAACLHLTTTNSESEASGAAESSQLAHLHSNGVCENLNMPC